MRLARAPSMCADTHCIAAGNMAESPDLADTARKLVVYAFTVVFGVALHGLLVLPGIYWFVTRKNPLTFMRGLSQALMTAFGTDSSAATLPVTILCCTKMGISSEVCQFVLPLGATVNMNGTALYEALTVIFIAQMHDEPLTVAHMVVIAGTSTLAAVGAAAIPSAGLVTMVMVLQAAGLDQYVVRPPRACRPEPALPREYATRAGGAAAIAIASPGQRLTGNAHCLRALWCSARRICPSSLPLTGLWTVCVPSATS